MSDEIVFDVLCTKVLDALRALGLGKFSIRNYYYEGMWPIIKVYRSEGVIFYSAAFTNEIVNRFHLDHENGLVADRIWAKVRKASILFEEYVQTGKIVWKRVRPDPKISLAPYYHELLRRFCQHEANTRAISGYGEIRPRLYDLRHTFATHRLYQWVKEGKDINACLAYLSEYMGHSNLESTAYYIHLLPTLYTDLPELRLDSSLEMEADLCD